MDISGGYTSVKDKTNISVISGDIYVHLSISVISLVLNLQSQAAAALQFGNADLLSPCTHFDQVWVSPKGESELCSIMLAALLLIFSFIPVIQVSDQVTMLDIHVFAENGHLNNLTFWRPRAPSNYVVLGDCVTSR